MSDLLLRPRWAALLAAAASPLSAQLSSPSPHFGASTIPDDVEASYLGVSVDRFTPNGKVTEPGIYNGIDRTLGFNFLTYSVAARSDRWAGLSYRATIQLGWGHDEPTAWLQRNLHLLADLPPVESMNPRNNVLDAAFGFEALDWGALGANAVRFLGGGITVGTPHSEAWLRVGARSALGERWPGLSGAVTIGAPFRGGAFPDATIARGYGAVEAMIDLPVGAWLDVPWLPSPFVSVRQDTGFFVDLEGNGIAEIQGSFGFDGPNGSWRFEAWNEYFGGRFKDIGPTGGGRIYVRVPRVGLLGWLP